MTCHCTDCRYWQGRASGKGKCVRHAPRPTVFLLLPHDDDRDISKYAEVAWPETRSLDTCGEAERLEH